MKRFLPGLLWGEDQAELGPSERNMLDADIGLLIAAPILVQREGERTITLEFEFVDESFDQFVTLIEKFASAMDELDELAAYDEIVKNAFDVSYTAEEGWSYVEYRLPTAEFGFAAQWDEVKAKSAIAIQFTLETGQTCHRTFFE